MADKEFEDDDPMELVGSMIGIGEDDLLEMGLTFVEELARMDWSQEEIQIIFSDPFYRGPHTVYRAKGPEYVKQLIVSVMGNDNPTPKPDGPGRKAEADAIRQEAATRVDVTAMRADFVPLSELKPAK